MPPLAGFHGHFRVASAASCEAAQGRVRWGPHSLPPRVAWWRAAVITLPETWNGGAWRAFGPLERLEGVLNTPTRLHYAIVGSGKRACGVCEAVEPARWCCVILATRCPTLLGDAQLCTRWSKTTAPHHSNGVSGLVGNLWHNRFHTGRTYQEQAKGRHEAFCQHLPRATVAIHVRAQESAEVAARTWHATQSGSVRSGCPLQHGHQHAATNRKHSAELAKPNLGNANTASATPGQP